MHLLWENQGYEVQLYCIWHTCIIAHTPHVYWSLGCKNIKVYNRFLSWLHSQKSHKCSKRKMIKFGCSLRIWGSLIKETSVPCLFIHEPSQNSDKLATFIMLLLWICFLLEQNHILRCMDSLDIVRLNGSQHPKQSFIRVHVISWDNMVLAVWYPL